MIQKEYNLTISTQEFEPHVKFGGDIWILDQEHPDDYRQTTLVTIASANEKNIQIRIDWRGMQPSDDEFETLLIPETGKLFLGAAFFWCQIDIKNINLERQESCVVFWCFERREETVIVISELAAESLTLDGQVIDKVSIDPPFESKDFDDRIEFDCPVFGHQTLRLK